MTDDKDKRIAELEAQYQSLLGVAEGLRAALAAAAPGAGIERLNGALQKIDSIAQVLLEGGYGKDGDNRAYRQIARLAQTWLRVKHGIADE